MPVLTLISAEVTPRLKYVLDLVFTRILETEWRLASPDHAPEDGIWYHPSPPSGARFLPCSGFLFRSDIAPYLPEVRLGETPILFPAATTGGIVDFDLLGAVFFLVTEYPQDDSPALDAHGRQVPEWSPLGRKKIYEQPLIHLWCNQLASCLGLPIPSRRFQFEITVDVDQPWKHLHKPAVVKWGGLIKDLIRFQFGPARERLKAIRTGKDPFDTYDEFLNLLSPDQLIFFILAGGNSPQDSRFSLDLTAYRELVTKLAKAGVRIGVHPSYSSSEDSAQLSREIARLRSLNGTVNHSRQHYLRYQLPGTFRQLIGLGIEHEYSIALQQHTGFRTGICIAYPWYDLFANEVTGLMLHPAMVMDRTLLDYMKLTPEQAKAEITRRILQVKQVHGCFVIILHNETLSDSGEWLGWKKVMIELIHSLKRL